MPTITISPKKDEHILAESLYFIANLIFSIKPEKHNSERENFQGFYQEKEYDVILNKIINKMLVHSALYIMGSQISFKKKITERQS